MSKELVRFSVAIPEDLLDDFDAFVAKRGTITNRSEAIRDLMRDALVNDECEDPDAEIMGTLTVVYSHHASDLNNRLDEIQHDHFGEIISTTHVHLDAHNCLEVIIMRGQSKIVHAISEAILGTKGVKHGRLVTTSTGKNLH